jgi:hypothetical protein
MCSVVGLDPPEATVPPDISLNAWLKAVYMFLGHTLPSIEHVLE